MMRLVEGPTLGRDVERRIQLTISVSDENRFRYSFGTFSATALHWIVREMKWVSIISPPALFPRDPPLTGSSPSTSSRAPYDRIDCTVRSARREKRSIPSGLALKWRQP